MTLTEEPKLRLFRFSRPLFQSSTPNANKLISFLTKVVNAGYDQNLKYGIITSTRIKSSDVFVDDLGLYKPEAFMMVLVKAPCVDGDLKTLLPSERLVIEDVTEEFDVEKDIQLEDILGTVGGKLYDGTDTDVSTSGWELTGVTSFTRGAGAYLINVMTDLAHENNKEFLVATVIYEHGLADYYAKFGYLEYGERLLQEVDENGLVVGGDLESGIYATRDFHIAFLRKDLK